MENTHAKLFEVIAENAERTEAALAEIMKGEDEDFGLIYDAQRYSLLGGGKRVRPFLVNECCRVLGGSAEASMPLACAIEMIHTYSLIHDDLPCMDDDDVRRGKPSNHKKFGYANALLAGDALLTGAFKVIADAETLSPEIRIKAVRVLAEAAGESGMIGGQIMDLVGETEELAIEKLIKLHSLKTAALMEGCAKLGCLAAGYDTDSYESEQLTEYARNVGVAFQVMDDVLDQIADEKILGKHLGADAEHNKTTFLTYYNVDEAKKYAEGLTGEAITAVSAIEHSELLTDFACYLLEREK